MIKNSVLLLVNFAVLAFCPLSRAQDQEPAIDSTIAVVRANMQADRAALITTGMNFNDKDGAAFWPIYEQYDHERSILDDRRAAVIKQYTQKYPNLTDVAGQSDGRPNVGLRISSGCVEEEVLQEVQQSPSGSHRDDVLSIGASCRSNDGHASRVLTSSPHAGEVHRQGK